MNQTLDQKIRLRQDKIDTIIRLFKELFPPEDGLWIFGSRVNMQAKGGDIDLYIETTLKEYEPLRKAQARFWTEMQKALGEQKIDLVINRNNGFWLPIYDVAKTEGIKLV